MMSKGEMPVGYIVAIVLGVVVIALLGYFIIVNYGPFRGVASEATCRAQLLQYCSFWSADGYDLSKKPFGNKDFYELNKNCDTEFSSKLGRDIKKACQEQLR